MAPDIVDKLLIQWQEERPELQPDGLGIVVRILHLAKLLGDRASLALDSVDLSLWEYDVLSALRRQGSPFELSASALATESRLSSGAMTNRIDRLEDRGLVERLTDPDDRRAIRVQLTDSGRQLMASALELRLNAADESLHTLSDNERGTFVTLLRKLLAHEESALIDEI